MILVYDECLPVSSSSSKAAATFVEEAKLCHTNRRHRNRIALLLRAAGSSMSSLRSPSPRAARNRGIQAEEKVYPLDHWPPSLGESVGPVISLSRVIQIFSHITGRRTSSKSFLHTSCTPLPFSPVTTTRSFTTKISSKA